MKNSKTATIIVTNKWTKRKKEIITTPCKAYACLNFYRKQGNWAIIK